MLVDVTITEPGPDLALGLALITHKTNIGYAPRRLALGLYVVGHWNGPDLVLEKHIRYPEFVNEVDESHDPSGVCDHPEQFLDTSLARMLVLSKRQFTVFFVPIKKSNQPDTDGWRWSKWGPYIGIQKPTTEYDEPEIEVVWTTSSKYILVAKPDPGGSQRLDRSGPTLCLLTPRVTPGSAPRDDRSLPGMVRPRR